MRRQKPFLLFLFLVFAYPAFAQTNPANQRNSSRSYFDISHNGLEKAIYTHIEISYMSPNMRLPEVYPSLVFQKGPDTPRQVTNKYVSKRAILRFNICNTADTVTAVWFSPGYYYSDIKLYKAEDMQLIPITAVSPKDTRETSYRLLSLAPHDSATIVAELTFVRTYLNKLTPRLIQLDYQKAFANKLYISNNDLKIFTYLFCGLLLMMILFALASYSQGGRIEFLYYSGYAFFVGIMLLLKAIYSWETSRINFFQESYLDFVLLCIGHLFYMAFMQKYLSTKQQHPFLQKLYIIGIITLLISSSAFTYAHFLTDNYILEEGIENYTKIILLVMAIIFLVYSFRHWQDQLLRYAFWGNLSLFVFSLASQILIMGGSLPKNTPPVLKASLSYYEIGLFLELIFFLIGLNFKTKRELVASARERERLKAENQMNEYEKEIAVYKAQQQERERISADMHDELGSGMTAIRLMSEIARNKMKESTPVEIEKISHSANEVLNKMNAIIWSMNSGNDTVDNLVSYIRAYALEYFEYTPIDCRIYTPETIEPTQLTGEKRRNLFLCVKETLNNALKHSKATELKIYFTINDVLMIKIVDNGVGIDLQKIRHFGNGLKNISKRMESIGGTYQIENNNGTITTLRLPL